MVEKCEPTSCEDVYVVLRNWLAEVSSEVCDGERKVLCLEPAVRGFIWMQVAQVRAGYKKNCVHEEVILQ